MSKTKVNKVNVFMSQQVLLLLLCVFADCRRPYLLPEGGGAIGLGGVEGEEEVHHAAHGCGLCHLQEVGERAKGVQRPHQILLFVQVRKICIKATISV